MRGKPITGQEAAEIIKAHEDGDTPIRIAYLFKRAQSSISKILTQHIKDKQNESLQ